jgi:hypothetical protein
LAEVTPTGSTAAVRQPKPRLADDWELDADLRGVERLLGTLKASSQPLQRDAGAAAHRHSANEPTSVHRHAAHEDSTRWYAAAATARPQSHSLAWCILALGLATFACGAVLLGWSFAAERDDLWPLGLPLALVGQAGLILGLVLQLDGLWQSNRQTSQSLTHLDDELSRVRHATTLLTTTKNASAQSFYAHMAEGASPQLLLADLKGQLDLLAQQMASQRR